MESSILLFLGLLLLHVAIGQYNVDDSGGTGPKFDGIGGLSGGGVSEHFKLYIYRYMQHFLVCRLPPGSCLVMARRLRLRFLIYCLR